METPIHDFINEYSYRAPARFHMPGHKGDTSIFGASADITEVKGTEDLIERSEANASEIFGCPTYYSAEGSSLAIRAMLSLLMRRTGKKTVVAARNCHQAFISSCALLDLEVVWIPSEGDLLSAGFELSSLDLLLAGVEPCCVYITSPDYLGFVSDISSIAAICHSHGVYLAVDNAHGAYLKFFGSHPMDLGADICCDSAHKTLPVLTGGAYLHVSDELNGPDVRRELALFASTSPSWIILASLDRANAIMADPEFIKSLKKTADRVSSLIENIRVKTYGNEYLKITICPNSFGYTGDEVADMLRLFEIEPEFSDMNYVTLMFSPFNKPDEFNRLISALESIDRQEPIDLSGYKLPKTDRAVSIREAVFSKTEVISVDDAAGRIAGFVKTSCPPAVPIVVAGERISYEHIEILKAYGFDTIEVCCDFE